MKKLKVIFEPGCFDNFDGTQEELDQLVSQITSMAENGDLEELLDEMLDGDFSNELAEHLVLQFSESMDVNSVLIFEDDELYDTDMLPPNDRKDRLN